MKASFEQLISHRKTYYSQNGEDGLVEFLLSKLPLQNKWCVEFGAWDGKYLSNTFFFISQLGYKSVLIEGDSSKFGLLKENMNKYGSICINKYVDIDGENKLDNILEQTLIPKEFDLLSIDVDGDDYHIWQTLERYTPKIVIIEINIRDKPTLERINKHNSPIVWGVTGTSIKSMTELAKQKGYSLIANVACNAIYVKEELLYLFYNQELTPDEVFLFEGHTFPELSFKEIQYLGWKRSLFKFYQYTVSKVSLNLGLYRRLAKFFEAGQSK